ncbi:MAG: (d)CMP kinase [Chlorobiaceae bacterium]|nr:(d)CMP kinase [Chlorobiaceae bacterium]NTV16121.1 (d)CMP kinase [Chlorobiaceae bacterium]
MKQEIGKKRIIIAIDGPAASGKSTTARRVAQQLGYTYIDTGAMYRTVTLKALQQGVLDDLRNSPESVSSLLQDIVIRFDGDRVLVDGRDVTAEIRENRVSREVSFISSLKPVRDRLREMQREMGRQRAVVMDGRDIGTVVFPDAELKIFLVADARKRAERRYAELIATTPKGTELPDLDVLEEEIKRRDRDDAEREHAPLRKHPEAHEIDTSDLTIERQVDIVYNLALEIEKDDR